jgi:Ferritin-like domain
MRRPTDQLGRVGGTRPPTRREFLQRAAVLGVGVVWTAHPPQPQLAGMGSSAACAETAQDMLNLAYTIERAATTFYYHGLTSPAVMRNPRLAGTSGNPTAVSRNGTPSNVANLQAALDEEHKHAQILANVGAVSPITRFYFPSAAFQQMGYTSAAGTFLWTLDHLETTVVAVYLAAIKRFGQLGRADLAVLCLRNLTIESEHRALYRVIAQDDPADNITLPVADVTCMSEALPLFTPYLTGLGFPPGVAVTPGFPMPTPAQTARVIGKYTSR